MNKTVKNHGIIFKLITLLLIQVLIGVNNLWAGVNNLAPRMQINGGVLRGFYLAIEGQNRSVDNLPDDEIIYDSLEQMRDVLPDAILKKMQQLGFSDNEKKLADRLLKEMNEIYKNMGLVGRHYHNSEHNLGVLYTMLLLVDNFKEVSSSRDKKAVFVAALLHDFHFRIPINDRGKGTAAYVEETINQIADLLGIKRYPGPVVGNARYEKVDEKLKAELSRTLQEFLGGKEEIELLFPAITAMIRRTDFPSDVAPAPPQKMEDARNVRLLIDKELSAADYKDLARVIALLKKEYDKIFRSIEDDEGLSSEQKQIAKIWVERQRGIEADYLKSLEKAGPDNFALIHRLSLFLEAADKASFYVLSSPEMAEKVVVPGLGVEVDSISPSGSYPFFFKSELLTPETLSILRFLPELYKRNFVDLVGAFAKISTEAAKNIPDEVPVKGLFADALSDWNSRYEYVVLSLELNKNEHITNEMLSLFGKSRISHLPGRDKYGEDLVKSLATGNKAQVAFLSIQDFKGQFNDRGTALDELAKKHPLDKISIFGHEFGDWGIQLTATALEEYLPQAIEYIMSRYPEEMSKAARPGFKVYNDAKSYWIIFENPPKFIKAGDILKELFKENSDFRKSVVLKVKARAAKRINQRLKAGEIDNVTAEKLKDALEGFTSRQFNIYGGISEAISLQETTLELTPVQAAHRLDSQAQFSAKDAQINFNGERLNSLVNELKQKKAISILRKRIKEHVDAARKAQVSRIREYNDKLAEGIELHKKYGERGEWESMYRPITAIYDEKTTHEGLLNEFYRALAEGDEREIERARENIFKKIVLYHLEPSIAGRAKRNIFFGNDRFKDIINYIIQEQPAFNWSGTVKIGGDEIGKIVWDADRKRLDVFRFDINNLGKINIQLGVRLGDKVIDEMIRLIDEVKDSHEYMRFIYNYFLNKNAPGSNLRDNPLEIAKEDYEYIAQRLKERNKSADDYFRIENGKYYLEKFPPVVVQEIDEATGAVIREYESSAAVSAGMMSINVNLINEQSEQGLDTKRDFSGMASGRADSAAEEVKAAIKHSQAENSGIITEDTFKMLDGTGEVTPDTENIGRLLPVLDLGRRDKALATYQKLYGLQQAVSYEKKALSTLPLMELSPARSVLAEFIINSSITLESIVGENALEGVDSFIDKEAMSFLQQAI